MYVLHPEDRRRIRTVADLRAALVRVSADLPVMVGPDRSDQCQMSAGIYRSGDGQAEYLEIFSDIDQDD